MKNRIILLLAINFLADMIYAQEITGPSGPQSGIEELEKLTSAPNESSKDSAAPKTLNKMGAEIKSTALQEPAPLQLHFPTEFGWNLIREGEKREFQLRASGGADSIYTFRINQGKAKGMEFDTLGNFSWIPDHDFVGRLSTDSTFQLIFEARNLSNERVQEVVELTVVHVNRPPKVGDLKPFYVRYNFQNTYTIEASAVKDEDHDPIVFIPVVEVMPQGAKLSPQGEFTWKPSLRQFRDLRQNPIQLEFYVEDQPSKARTKGVFLIRETQEDLPPSIQMAPAQNYFQYKEDATINIKFHLDDPNGESDITSFSFISDNPNIPASALVKNTATQYEFIWKPGYDFVKDPLDSLSFFVTFYVMDKSNKKDERTVRFTILNAINEAEVDHKLYIEYRASLVRAWDLMEQLKEAENDLKKKYKRSRKGKKARSLTNASLGAGTGIAPVVVDDPLTSKKITTVGGTAVMTIGTLEATEVFGRNSKDLVERLNYIIEKRNELQTKGDIFARKYALKSSRRRGDFMKDVDDFVAIMNLKGLVALELDAAWQNKNKPTNSNVAKTFKDFSPEN